MVDLFKQEQMDAVKVRIRALDAAITALASGSQSYMLDTGQSRQSVTKANLMELRLTLRSSQEEYERLRQALGGQYATVVRPVM